MMQHKIKIDLNADLGEGAANDAALMPLISSCSIACGGHAGDKKSIIKSLLLAKKHRVSVGAHPSFPDKDTFGRRFITMTKSQLTQSVFNQIMLFTSCCEEVGMKMNHVKLHGALYNYAAKDAATSVAVVDAILQSGMRPILYVSPQSVLAEKAKDLLPIRYEGFIDRAYNSDRSLVSRNKVGALIQDKVVALNQLLEMVLHTKVSTIDGGKIPICAATFCIHGDTENAIEILEYIRGELPKHGIAIQ